MTLPLITLTVVTFFGVLSFTAGFVYWMKAGTAEERSAAWEVRYMGLQFFAFDLGLLIGYGIAWCCAWLVGLDGALGLW